MPRRGRSNADVDSGGTAIHAGDAAQHQGIALAYLSEGADSRGIVQRSGADECVVPQSGVVLPGQVTAVFGASRAGTRPCVVAARRVNIHRLVATGSVALAGSVVVERLVAAGGVSSPTHRGITGEAEEGVKLRGGAEGEGTPSQIVGRTGVDVAVHIQRGARTGRPHSDARAVGLIHDRIACGLRTNPNGNVVRLASR